MTDIRAYAGLARSLAIYRARPWRVAALARFYGSFLGAGDLAFDVGAHVGNRTRALVRAGVRVVALEPQAVFHRFLRHDLPAGVTLLPLAAGAAEGEARLAVSRAHPTVSSLTPGFAARMATQPGFTQVRWDAEERVGVTTLDALAAIHGTPAFVKIDVEGFEAEVLRGLSTPVRWLSFEYLAAAPTEVDACLDRLADLGDYRFNLVTGEHTTFAWDAWVGANVLRARLFAGGLGTSGDVYARLELAA